MKKTLMTFAASTALLAATGCVSGGSGGGPDEFRVVKKAPLVIPPDYSLRPPQAGQAQPFEVDAERAGVATAFGTTYGAEASASERALVAAAGANAVSPVIREQIDYEEAGVIRKSPTISDRVMFWRNDEADTEVDSATGGGEVTIARGAGSRKLPGT